MIADRFNKKNKLSKTKYWDFSFKKEKKKDKKDKIEKKDKKRKRSEESDDDGEDIKFPKLDAEQEATSIERKGNHIYFYSEVSRDSIFTLNMLINEVEEENLIGSITYGIDPIPIYLHINSYGGSVHAALSCIDTIKACKVPVYTICEGAIASAGTLISVVGTKRFMRPSAYLLIHQLSSGFWGKMNEIEDEYINLKALMKKIRSIYKEHCNIPKKELKEILKHDLWWDYEKCVEMGLVDGLYPMDLNKNMDKDEEEEEDDE
jgi:ATP-dependent Clp endopeptidase proteolytic subunit ClpP